MNAPRIPARPIPGFLLLILMVSPLGCRPNETAVKPESLPTTSVTPDASVDNSSVEEEILIPEGTPEELMQFLQEVETEQLGRGRDVAAEAVDPTVRALAVRRLMKTRIRVCDKLLSREIPPDTHASAVQMKLDALRTLAAMDSAEWNNALTEFAQQLIDGSDPLLARLARATLFQAQVNDFISLADGDSQAWRAALRDLLQDPEAGAEIFRATRDAAGWLVQTGRTAAAAEALAMIGRRFQDDPDENLAAEAVTVLSQATNIQLSHLARNVLAEEPGAIAELTQTMTNMLQSDSSDPNLLAYTMQTAQMLEYAGHSAGARQAYDLILQHYQSQPESSTAKEVARTVQLAHRRLDLVGQPLSIEGVLLDGSAFNWQDYHGKDVLLCFWTTWYENWLRDVDQIRDAVRDYRAGGLEVVTINLDDDRNLLERFLQTHPLPWPVVVNPDPMAAGFENVNAKRCGVEAVPLALLVNRDGVVTDLHLLGGRLPTVLQQRLGP